MDRVFCRSSGAGSLVPRILTAVVLAAMVAGFLILRLRR